MLCKHAGLAQRETAAVPQMGSGAAVRQQQHKPRSHLGHDRRLLRRVNEIEARLTAPRQP
jgi:hypothetical protein